MDTYEEELQEHIAKHFHERLSKVETRLHKHKNNAAPTVPIYDLTGGGGGGGAAYYWFGSFVAAEFLNQDEVAGFEIVLAATAVDTSHITSGFLLGAGIITADGPGAGPAVDTDINNDAWHTIYCETEYVGSGDFSGLNYHAWRYLQKTDGVTAFESTAVYFSDIDVVVTGINVAVIFQNDYYVSHLTIVLGSTYSHTFNDGTLGPFSATSGTHWVPITVAGVDAIAGNLTDYPGTLGINHAPGAGVTFASIEYTAFFPAGWP